MNKIISKNSLISIINIYRKKLELKIKDIILQIIIMED